MNPHPRIRKTVKWGGAVTTVLLVAIWAVSGWYRVVWAIASSVAPNETRWVFSVTDGVGYLQRIDDYFGRVAPPGWHIYHVPHSWRWSLSDNLQFEAGSVSVPLWPLIFTSAAITALAWRLDTLARRRASTGSCPACGYALAGLPAGAPCAECGRGAASGANPVS